MVKKKSRNAKKGRNLSRQKSNTKKKFNQTKVDEKEISTPLSPASVIQNNEDFTVGKHMPETPLNDAPQTEVTSKYEAEAAVDLQAEKPGDHPNNTTTEQAETVLSKSVEVKPKADEVVLLVSVEDKPAPVTEPEATEPEKAAEQTSSTPEPEAVSELPKEPEAVKPEPVLEVEQEPSRPVEDEPAVEEIAEPVLKEKDAKHAGDQLPVSEVLIPPAIADKNLSLTEPMEKEASDGIQGCDCNKCVIL